MTNKATMLHVFNHLFVYAHGQFAPVQIENTHLGVCGNGGMKSFSPQRMPKLIVAILAAAFTLRADAGIRANPPAPKTTPQAIEGSVTCQCGGCNMTLSTCNHEGCGSKAEMEAMAEKEAASGKDSAAILQDFVLKYGTKVLATPPPNGFNLMVWILPICGGIIGLTLIAVLLRRWRRVQQSAAEVSETVPVDPEMMAEIEEEMKKVSG